MIIEPIQGEGGFIVPASGFLPAISQWCTDNGVVFVADEIQTWFARTGAIFACEHEGIVPDLIATAKGIAGGLPLAGEVVAALAKRGIADLENVLIDTWTYAHSLIPEEYPGRRLGWTDTWLRASETGNPDAHPVDGLHVILDMNTMEVLRIEDSFSIDRPDVMGEYVPALVPDLVQRTDIKPLMVHQPEGRR